MNPTGLLNWMLLSTVLLGAWWLCYRLALRPERSFAYNRWFLVLGPVLAAGLPLLPVAWPAGWGAGAAAWAGVASVQLPLVQVGPGGAAATASVNGWVWLEAIYVAGLLLALLRLGWALGSLWRSTRRLAREQHIGYALVRTHGRLPTSSFGRVVFWDETLALSPAEAAQVLRHELAHVRQHHTHDRLLLELLQAVLWFNPFVYLCGRALALTHEFLADEAALAADAAPAFSPAQSYAHLLARQVASRLGFSVPLAHSFSQSETLRRIAMIQKTSPIRRWKQWLALPLLGALLFTVACEKAVSPATPPPITLSSVQMQDLRVPPPPPSLYKTYTYAEQMPELTTGGGNQAILGYIQRHLAYPKVAPDEVKEGIVFVQFVVTDQGAIDQVYIAKGLSPAYDQAVVAAVRQLPRFTPGRQDGKAVAISFTMPVRFAQTAPAEAH